MRRRAHVQALSNPFDQHRAHCASKSARAAGVMTSSGTGAAAFAVGLKFGEDLGGGEALATIQFCDGFEEFVFQFGPRRNHEAWFALLVFLEAAETSANYFAGGLVEAAFDLLFDKLLKFGRDGDVHGGFRLNFYGWPS